MAEGVGIDPGASPPDPHRARSERSPEISAPRTGDEHPRLIPRQRGGSLFDAKSSDHDNPYGEPGPPLSRSSAFYRGFWAAFGVLLAAVLGIAVVEVRAVLELLLVSVFLAVGLNPVVEFLIRRGLKRGWAVLIVAVLLVGVVSLVTVVFVEELRAQIVTFVNDAPRLINDLRSNKMIKHLDGRWHLLSDLGEQVENPNLPEKIFTSVFGSGLGALRTLVQVLIVFVVTLYLLLGLPQLKRAMYSLAPRSRRARLGQLGDEILRRVGEYVVGAFLVALLAGTVTALFLLTAGLGTYVLPLAVLVALLDLVPLVGSILGATIVTIVCLANSLDIGLAALCFYLVYEPLEGYFIYPRVMRSSIDVPEYVTILAVLLGGALDGVIGALLALPTAAGLLLLVREVWVRRQDRS
jgi:predicted PurR-regulated permease PerM